MNRLKSPAQQLPISVLIPTLNEARNLPDCLASVAWADEIIVFDSYSDDATLEIAKAQNARVVQRRFDNFSAHKNWALANIDFNNEWILIIDADERATPELAEEIQHRLASNENHAGYYLARKIIWRGRWLRHGGRYPDYNLRLLRQGKGHYEQRLVHEHMLVEGSTDYLQQPLLHNDDKGIERYIERHNHYSTLEAVEILRAQYHYRDQYRDQYKANQGQQRIRSNWLQVGPHRRRALKTLAYRYLPARPLFVFLYLYFIKLGLLDGRGGFDSALLRAVYEYQIDLKLRELRSPESPLARRWQPLIVSKQPCGQVNEQPNKRPDK